MANYNEDVQKMQWLYMLTTLQWYTITLVTVAMIFFFRSDIYISAICSNCYGATYYIYTSDMLLNLLNEQKTINRDQFDMLYIESMEVRHMKIMQQVFQ